MHAQQLPPGTAMGPHPGIPGLPGLGPGAGIPVPTSASALLSLGLPPGAAATPGGTAAHPLSMLTKPDLHRGQPDDLKPNGGKRDLIRLSGDLNPKRRLVRGAIVSPSFRRHSRTPLGGRREEKWEPVSIEQIRFGEVAAC